MFVQVDTRIPTEVERQIRSIYGLLFPGGDKVFVQRAFSWAGQCFHGQYGDYQPIDARYHDFEHTLQGTLCLARLLQGRHLARATPVLTQHLFELAILAILFHDTGYLKKRDDTVGTGAKYTVTHVARSTDFARQFLADQGYRPDEIEAVGNMIRCTGLDADLKSIPFQSDLEKILGFALASSDLLGQMAARDYVDKLPILYQEFAEAAQYDAPNDSSVVTYKSPEDLVRRTPSFWKDYVLPRLHGEFGKLCFFLNDPYPDGPNPYLISIEENLQRIQQLLQPGKA